LHKEPTTLSQAVKMSQAITLSHPVTATLSQAGKTLSQAIETLSQAIKIKTLSQAETRQAA